MAARVEMTENECTVLTALCAALTKAMCTQLIARGFPAPREALQKAITEAMTDSFIQGRLDLRKLN